MLQKWMILLEFKCIILKLAAYAILKSVYKHITTKKINFANIVPLQILFNWKEKTLNRKHFFEWRLLGIVVSDTINQFSSESSFWLKSELYFYTYNTKTTTTLIVLFVAFYRYHYSWGSCQLAIIIINLKHELRIILLSIYEHF